MKVTLSLLIKQVTHYLDPFDLTETGVRLD